ncbi:hypothetical protein [Novosphingobium sp.]|uniref:hypothetical protein n=1 Tax=Novosphingobium sp. TaxID=1874826 RepID=UPI0035B1F446
MIALFAFSRAVQDLVARRVALFPTLAPAIAILVGIPLAVALKPRCRSPDC